MDYYGPESLKPQDASMATRWNLPARWVEMVESIKVVRGSKWRGLQPADSGPSKAKPRQVEQAAEILKRLSF
jgi:hypothetical protein